MVSSGFVAVGVGLFLQFLPSMMIFSSETKGMLLQLLFIQLLWLLTRHQVRRIRCCGFPPGIAGCLTVGLPFSHLSNLLVPVDLFFFSVSSLVHLSGFVR